MVTKATCPALFFCAPASGQGKTTITAGIARYHKNQGLDVRVFKTGPDYLDPLILAQASGHPVKQLDLWMVGETTCKQFLYEAALEADLILIEGVMGMFDGNPSGADMALFFGIPIVAIIDSRAMAQTFSAVAYGLATYRPENSYSNIDFSLLNFAGVIANKVGSERHADLIKESMPNNVTLLACLYRDDTMLLPERHLGLVFPHEVDDIDQRLDLIAERIADSDLSLLPQSIDFYPSEFVQTKSKKGLAGKTIAIAKDNAFSFIYDANVEFLKQQGANVIYFSPLAANELPSADALWFPGGYPELYLDVLQNNESLKKSIHDFFNADKKILAECGGMLYIQNTLTTLDKQTYNMVGLISGDGIMRDRGGCQGMQYAPVLGDGCSKGELRAHAHHRSRSENTIEAYSHGRRLRHQAPGEAIFKSKGLLATYLHLYFPSNPQVVIELFS